ncbi:hypothetical protein PIB30_018196 [Stylosanthes scabra]|uniref:DUF4283 domain-containing protein n=1 Tax=Stylosanthes scabra TaxID=79078 RepID=A0ABU6T9V1_9FABA|nr:hypothetical protein [Stylosanthes scabra]
MERHSLRDVVAGVNENNHDHNDNGWQVLKNRRRRDHVEEGERIWDAKQGVVTVFEDNLPKHITKRFLYREFRRYDAKGGAVRAREGLHGSFVAGKPIFVKESIFERTSRKNEAEGGVDTRFGLKKKWILTTQPKLHHELNYGNEDRIEKVEKQEDRKIVTVNASKKQKDLLDRSVIAESFEPIKFRYVVEAMKKFNEEYGKIECRDLGPRKCILTFLTSERRDKALSKAILDQFFNKVRPYWGFKWSRNRRVWVELMGLPLHVWSEETFMLIAKGVDAKLVMQNELTKEGASFSVARILWIVISGNRFKNG